MDPAQFKDRFLGQKVVVTLPGSKRPRQLRGRVIRVTNTHFVLGVFGIFGLNIPLDNAVNCQLRDA